MISKAPLEHLPLLTELIRSDPATSLKLALPKYELSTTAHFAGLVAVGGNFASENLVHAYENGIFPWPHGSEVDLWFSPVWRGIIEFHKQKIPKSLVKFSKRHPYTFKINTAFEQVMENCSSVPRKGQVGTWIVDELKDGFFDLHKKGYAHSVEAWMGERLVAGIYGVCVNGNFSAESMFGLESNSSKLCLLKLMDWLKNSGFEFLDIQMLTPVTQSLGGRYIKRKEFLQRLLDLRNRTPQLNFRYKV